MLSQSIQVIFGPMFSGKSTELKRRIELFELARKRCLVVKFAADTRYEGSAQNVVTHDQQMLRAKAARTLSEVENVAHSYDVIGVDEGQFFPDVVEACEVWANAGKIVIVCGLDGTFQRVPFNRMLELVPLAERVDKLTAVCCVCHADAAFTRRLGNETAVEIIGGADKYVATCRKCFFAPLQHCPAPLVPLSSRPQQQPRPASPASPMALGPVTPTGPEERKRSVLATMRLAGAL